MNLGINTYAYSWALNVSDNGSKNPPSALNLIDIAENDVGFKAREHEHGLKKVISN